MLEKTTASGRRPPFSGYRHGWCSLRWRRDSPEETRHQASPCLTGWVEHTYNSGSMEDHSWMVEMMSGVPAVMGISFSEGFVWDNASFTYTGPTLVGPNFHIKEAKNSRQTSVWVMMIWCLDKIKSWRPFKIKVGKWDTTIPSQSKMIKSYITRDRSCLFLYINNICEINKIEIHQVFEIFDFQVWSKIFKSISILVRNSLKKSKSRIDLALLLLTLEPLVWTCGAAHSRRRRTQHSSFK